MRDWGWTARPGSDRWPGRASARLPSHFECWVSLTWRPAVWPPWHLRLHLLFPLETVPDHGPWSSGHLWGWEKEAVVYGFEQVEECAGWDLAAPSAETAPPQPDQGRRGRGTQGPRGQGRAAGPGGASSGQVHVSLLSGRVLTVSSSPSLLPAVAHEHLKERGLLGLPPSSTNPSDYYHQMPLMAGHPTPYGDLLMQSGGAASAPHLHDYLNPVDGECWARVGVASRTGAHGPPEAEEGACCSFCGGGSPVEESGVYPNPCHDCCPWGTASEQHAQKLSESSRARKCCRNCSHSREQKGLISAFMELTYSLVGRDEQFRNGVRSTGWMRVPS